MSCSLLSSRWLECRHEGWRPRSYIGPRVASPTLRMLEPLRGGCLTSSVSIATLDGSLWLPVTSERKRRSSRLSPCSSVSKESAYSARDLRSMPGSGRSPEGGNGNPLQYSCLENPMDRGAQWVTVHGLQTSDTTERLTLSRTRHLTKREYGFSHKNPKKNAPTWTP